MPAGPIVVSATPTGGHWHVEIPGHSPITTRTLAMAESMTARRLPAGFDLQVDLGGLEDLCTDTVEAGKAADSAHITALKARRTVVRALKAAGGKPVDISYLTGIPTETVDKPAPSAGGNTVDDDRDDPMAKAPTAPSDLAGRRYATRDRGGGSHRPGRHGTCSWPGMNSRAGSGRWPQPKRRCLSSSTVGEWEWMCI